MTAALEGDDPRRHALAAEVFQQAGTLEEAARHAQRAIASDPLDLRSTYLLARLRHSPEALSLPEGAPGRAGALARFLGSFVTGRPEVERWSDPRPAWRESVQWFRGVLGSRGSS